MLPRILLEVAAARRAWRLFRVFRQSPTHLRGVYVGRDILDKLVDEAKRARGAAFTLAEHFAGESADTDALIGRALADRGLSPDASEWPAAAEAVDYYENGHVPGVECVSPPPNTMTDMPWPKPGPTYRLGDIK